MNMLTKRFGAKYVLPIAMFIFGSCAMLSAACTNFGGIVTTRWFLGMAESGFYPGNGRIQNWKNYGAADST